MKYLAALTALLSVAAADWTIYCGDSCSNGTAVATGSSAIDASGVSSCTSLGGTYEYCYFECDVSYWKAIIYERSDCLVDGETGAGYDESAIFNGECTPEDSWSAYEVVENL